MRLPAHSVLAASVSVAILLAACGRNEPGQLLESARTFAAKKDYRSEIIQLKGFLQQQPDSAEARSMLGRAYLDSGDPVSATIELRRALSLKRTAAEVVPPLVQALLLTRQYKSITDEFGALSLPGNAGADLKSSVSIAHLAQGQTKEAEKALAEALQASPDFPRAWIIQARQSWLQRRVDEAFARVEHVLQQEPGNLEGLILKGDLLRFARNDPSAALATYRLAAKADPTYLAARSSVIAVLLDQKDFQAASEEIALLRKAFPDQLTPALFDAQLAYLRKDQERARTLTAQLLKAVPRNSRALLLAGAVALSDGSLVQAETHLVLALQLEPQLSPARLMLSQVYLRSGQPSKALTALQPLLALTPPDASTLALAAEAYMQAGDIDKAEENFAKASQLNPADVRSRTALAITRLERRPAGEGDFSELQALAAVDAGYLTDLAIVSTHIRRAEFKAALAAIDALEKKLPGDALVPNLRGRVQVTLKDIPAARRSFERALSLNPKFVSAAGALAALDLADGKPDQAQRRFEDVRKADPANLAAMLGLAGLKTAAHRPRTEIEPLLVEAARTHPGEPVPRLLLVDFYLNAGDTNKALSIAQDAVAALPEDLELLDGLARAQLASGDTNQAIATFDRVASRAPRSTGALLRLAEAYKVAHNDRAYVAALTRALAIQPDLVVAQRAMIEYEMGAKHPEKALVITRTMQKQHPELVAGYSLEGAVLMTQGAFSDALKAYRIAFSKAPSGQTAEDLHKSLGAAGQAAEADRLAASWRNAHPADPGFLFYLGDIAMAKQDWPAAERHFRASIAANEANPLALNNLAWVLLKLHKPGALPLAARANELKPKVPQVLDTLAAAQASEGQFAKALETQKQALALNPASANLRFHLAKLYIQAGTKDAARTELETLAKLGTQFSDSGEVTRLLESL